MTAGGEDLIRLTVRGIQEKLQTGRLGRTCYLFPSIDSTNRKAMAFARRGVPEGTLVIAENQTQGKGRLNRSWFSPPFLNLTFSLVLNPSPTEENASRFTFASCVALAEGLEKMTGIRARLKWPNDILVREKKISGLLSEYLQTPSGETFLILGIGVNVNTPRALWPREIADQTGSLREILGEPLDREMLLAGFLTHLEKWYTCFLTGDWQKIFSHWKALSSTLGKKVMVKLEEQEISGYALDLNPDGALLLKREDGEIISIYSGDVVHVRDVSRSGKGTP